jgi:hypothetical protein
MDIWILISVPWAFFERNWDGFQEDKWIFEYPNSSSRENGMVIMKIIGYGGSYFRSLCLLREKIETALYNSAPILLSIGVLF